jgi:cobyrinic acid a,c-diamide synthase
MKKPVIFIGAAGSGTGKTTVSLALMSALVRRGLKVQPFKCGPDYIDPGHHTRVCGRVSRNLDTWMTGSDGVLRSFARGMDGADCAVVEGVMGLFDGVSPVSLDGSSAEVAKILGAPVALVIDARGVSRTIAPSVRGFTDFEDGVEVAAVIANRTGSDRHRELLRTALEAAKLPPLLGALPKDKKIELPERHLGVLPACEDPAGPKRMEILAELAEKHIDIDSLLKISEVEIPEPPPRVRAKLRARPKLAVALDKAFNFYYQENLEALEDAGIELVFFSPMEDTAPPAGAAGLYIGGGFPELFAGRLTENTRMRASVKAFAAKGGIIIAECGGLMWLSSALEDLSGARYEMCGVLPGTAVMGKRLRRLGCVSCATLRDSALGPAGTVFRGHEFHWSALEFRGAAPPEPAFQVEYMSGEKLAEPDTSAAAGNVTASYIHTHFASNPDIPTNIFSALSASSQKI